MRNKGVQVFWVIVFVILGIAITLQIKSVNKQNTGVVSQSNLKNLQELLKREKDYSAALKGELKTYEKKLEQYESQSISNTELDNLKKEMNEAKFKAGLTDVKGQGIIITLDDSKERAVQGLDTEDLVIHDGDLLRVINYLRMIGAEAISLNDERIVSTSETQCSGPTVSVNGVRYPVPYVIKTVGNADYMEAKLKAMNEWENVLGYLKIRGIQIKIEKNNNIFIPRYRNFSSNLSYISQIGGQ